MTTKTSLFKLLSEAIRTLGGRSGLAAAVILPYVVFDSAMEQLLPDDVSMVIRFSVFFANLALYVLFEGALAIVISDSLEGRPIGFFGGFARAWAKYSNLFWVQIQYLVGCLWRAVLLLIPSFPYAMKYALAPVHAALSDTSDGQDAFDVSDQLTDGYRWPLFAAAVLTFVPPLLLLIQRAFWRKWFSATLYLALDIPLSTVLAVLWQTLQVSFYRQRLSARGLVNA